METRKLGTHGLEASALGLGCTGMSEFYGSTDGRGDRVDPPRARARNQKRRAYLEENAAAVEFELTHTN